MNFLKIILVFCFCMPFISACKQSYSTGAATHTINSDSVDKSVVDAARPATAGELAAGGKIYAESCVRCHKENGTGGIAVIDGKNVRPPNLTSERQKREPDSEYIDIIENGAPSNGMPAYKGKIGDDDIKNLVKYIRKEFQGK